MYQIKVLEDREFDKLPFKHVKESLGCADPKTNTAYVRNTHWGSISKSVNLLTIQHELDELLATVSPHEEDGIRYKKGGVLRSIVPTLLAFVPGVGPLLSAVSATGMDQYAKSQHPEQLGKPGNIGDMLGTAALAYGGAKVGQGAVKGFTSPGTTASTSMGQVLVKPTLAQSLTGAAKGAVGMGAVGNVSGITAPTTTMQPFGALGTNVPVGPSIGNVGSPTNLAGAMTGLSDSSLLSETGRTATGVQPSAPAVKGLGTTAADASSKLKESGSFKLSEVFGDVLESPGKMLGLNMLSAASMPTEVSLPNIGEVTSKWLTSDSVTKAGEKAKDIADTTYLSDEYAPSKQTMGLIEVVQGDITKQYKQRATDLDRMGLAVNDQWMTSGERLEMLQKLEEEKVTAIGAVEKEQLASDYQQYSQNKYNYIIGQLAADETTKRDLLYGELADIINRYNIEQADLLNFRKIAADAGMYLFTGGTQTATA